MTAIYFLLLTILMQLFCMDIRQRPGFETDQLGPWAFIGWVALLVSVLSLEGVL